MPDPSRGFIPVPPPAVPGDLRVVVRADGQGPRVELSATVRTVDEASTMGAILSAVAGLVGLLNPPPVSYLREEESDRE